jgi:hypothetical protein
MVTADVLNSPVLPFLQELEALGVRFRLDGDQVLVSPRGVLTLEQREVFRRHQAAVRVLVAIVADTDVQARRDAFRQQVEATPAPMVPAFFFKVGICYTKGRCFSCGDALSEWRFGRCWRCAVAWRLAYRLPVLADLAAAMDSAKVLV